MPDMGYRDNVMGPQPIAARKAVPESLLNAVHRILDLIADGKGGDASSMAEDSAKDELAQIAVAVKAGVYNDKSIVGTARTNDHYWIKTKLTGPDAKPLTIQFRMGPNGDSWLIWQVTNLSDARSAWTR